MLCRDYLVEVGRQMAIGRRLLCGCRGACRLSCHEILHVVGTTRINAEGNHVL